MSLERKAIRRAIKRALLGETAAGQNVRGMTEDPIRPDIDGVASLQVYSLQEDGIEQQADSPREYLRPLELSVEIFLEKSAEALDSDDLADLLDDVCDQVECVVDPCIPALNGITVEGRPGTLSVNPTKSGLTRVEVGEDRRGRALNGAARLVYTIFYGSLVDERERARPRDFRGLNVRYDIRPPGAPAGVEAVDRIDTPPPGA